MDVDGEHKDGGDNTNPRPAVVRGARACTVCRQAKMKCIGADDGAKRCQRCERTGQTCIFEKHKRGRKPGSKLSEASKMLRRLEKGLNNAKAKSQTAEASSSAAYPAVGSHSSRSTYNGSSGGSPFEGHYSNHLPPIQGPSYPPAGEPYPNSSSSQHMAEEDEEDPDRIGKDLFPSKIIRKETDRNSFFRTILNPEHEQPNHSATSFRSSPNRAPFASPTTSAGSTDATADDPISTGIIDEHNVSLLFELLFIRLNPFINLFDPALHTMQYVRPRSKFLFTTLIMACCKFFRPHLFKKCQELAQDLAIKAFMYSWKSVEVVQAFACLTYWKDPDDNRTWTYIGFACRMAVELGLNHYYPRPPMHETQLQWLERRNRERTYLVLFIHDRSLATQTGRLWMLPECELVRNSGTWHEDGVLEGIGAGKESETLRPEDVIIASFVQIRKIVAETTDLFRWPNSNQESSYESILRNCNAKIAQWTEQWERQMRRANGTNFHHSFYRLFMLYVKLFINSFGIQSALSPTSRATPSLQTVKECYTSALRFLKIIYEDFTSTMMLSYSQESITVMSAYASIFLLRLLRSPNIPLYDGAEQEFYTHILKTADAYHTAAQLSVAITSADFHSRFLSSLVETEKKRKKDSEMNEGLPIDPRLQGPSQHSSPPYGHYHSQPSSSVGPSAQHGYGQAHTQSQQSMGQHDNPYRLSTAFAPSTSSSQQQHHPQSSSQDYSHTPPPMGYAQSNSRSSNAYTSGSPGYLPAVHMHQTYNPTTIPTAPSHVPEPDKQYWRNMFEEVDNMDSHHRQQQSRPLNGVNEGVSGQQQQQYQMMYHHSHHHQPSEGGAY